MFVANNKQSTSITSWKYSLIPNVSFKLLKVWMQTQKSSHWTKHTLPKVHTFKSMIIIISLSRLFSLKPFETKCALNLPTKHTWQHCKKLWIRQIRDHQEERQIMFLTLITKGKKTYSRFPDTFQWMDYPHHLMFPGYLWCLTCNHPYIITKQIPQKQAQSKTGYEKATGEFEEIFNKQVWTWHLDDEDPTLGVRIGCAVVEDANSSCCKLWIRVHL